MDDRRLDELRGSFEFWNDHGLDAYAERYWAEDMHWEEPPLSPDRRVHEGREAAVRRMRERFGAIGRPKLRLVGAGEVGGVLVLEIRVAGQGPSSGAPVEVGQVLVVVPGPDGRARQMYEFMDRPSAEAKARELASPG